DEVAVLDLAQLAVLAFDLKELANVAAYFECEVDARGRLDRPGVPGAPRVGRLLHRPHQNRNRSLRGLRGIAAITAARHANQTYQEQRAHARLRAPSGTLGSR